MDSSSSPKKEGASGTELELDPSMTHCGRHESGVSRADSEARSGLGGDGVGAGKRHELEDATGRGLQSCPGAGIGVEEARENEAEGETRRGENEHA